MRSVILCLAAASIGCAGACPAGRACGAATWRGAAIDGAMRVLAAAEVDDGSTTDGTSFAVTPRGARLRFELDTASVGRAVLSLREVPGGSRRGTVTLRARAILGPWRADDAPRSAASTSVTLAAGARGPVRLDLTDALREAEAWGAFGGVALETDGASLRFAGVWDAQGAARLEVAAP